MGSKVVRSASSGLLAVIAAASLGGCALDSEPTSMCGSLKLGEVHTRDLGSSSATVVVLSDGAERITVVRACDPEAGPCAAELVAQSISLPIGDKPDQLLLTASGRWVTYRVGSNLKKLDLAQANPEPDGGPGGVDEIVGSLRGGDWVIYRSWGDGDPSDADNSGDSKLWAYYVGDSKPGDPNGPSERHFMIGEGTDFDLRVAAIGHRHLVARRILGNGDEELYLVRIAPARRHDELAGTEIGEPILLARGDRFTRVLITTGESPAEHGDPWEFQHEVPTDVRVIATSGSGANARTLIYAVADTSQIANFEGAVVSSPLPLESITGLEPISPSGTHLAYITPRGSLALRDLESQGSCMIRPATSAKHVLAGFGADGTLYFESRERGRAKVGGATGSLAEIIYAYDPSTEDFDALTDDQHNWRLYAVPPKRYIDELGRAIPWAVVAMDGFYAARPAGADPSGSKWLDATPQPLYYDEVSFLPRGDESLWLLEGEEADGFGESNSLTVRRVQPNSGATHDDALVFDSEGADPMVLESGETEPELFTRSYASKDSICVSTSQSASHTTPWATTCSTPDSPTSYLDSGLPQGEHD